ncbi:hypothetical protein [Sphingobium sp. MK2]|uniref:hypothetical protein n=1 Tax=Sphingobium sp. MK2 TaxID=3116540 RepID=UPI0032E359C4
MKTPAMIENDTNATVINRGHRHYGKVIIITGHIDADLYACEVVTGDTTTEVSMVTESDIEIGDALPDGLWERDGIFYYECGSCGYTTEWHGEPEDFVFGDPHNVCGGSPRCCP